MECPICLSADATVVNHLTRDVSNVDSPKCFKFTISRSASVNLKNVDRSVRWRISSWLFQYQPSTFNPADIEQALGTSVPGLLYRANRMLKTLAQQFPHGYGFAPPAVYERLTSVGWNRNTAETRSMMEDVLLAHLGFLVEQAPGSYKISPKGLLNLEGESNSSSTIGFCAMWFSDAVKPLWLDVIEPAIRATGYEPLRINSKQHNGKIDDEIMASIRGSRFVVADFTDSRGGVYYEAGFAHGLDLPVIFMCREGDDLHFDIRPYNCIFWTADALEDAQARLKNRILATLGQGPLKV